MGMAVPMLPWKLELIPCSTCRMEFSCNRNGLNNSLCSHGDFSDSPMLLLMLVQDFSSAKEMSPAGMFSDGMIPAVPKLSFRVMIANRKPSMDPAGVSSTEGMRQFWDHSLQVVTMSLADCNHSRDSECAHGKLECTSNARSLPCMC